MTRYTVVWVESAQSELASIWLSASNRNAVTVAADEIDRVLATDATDQGVNVSEGLRALFVQPLRVLFTASDEDRIAEVLRVRRL